MSVRSFLDTNVLVYTDAHDARKKQQKALALVERERIGQGVVSTQVLQEYFATVTRKLGVPALIARRKLELFAHFEVVVIQVDDILRAIDLHRLHKLAFWDALIVHAALQAGCSVLYTEDLPTGTRIDGLKIINPFA